MTKTTSTPDEDYFHAGSGGDRDHTAIHKHFMGAMTRKNLAGGGGCGDYSQCAVAAYSLRLREEMTAVLEASPRETLSAAAVRIRARGRLVKQGQSYNSCGGSTQVNHAPSIPRSSRVSAYGAATAKVAEGSAKALSVA